MAIVSGLVATKDGRWLFVKKKYSGLKGKWSLPAGFVNEGETVDEAVKREVLEETGIVAHVKGSLVFDRVLFVMRLVII